MPDDGRAAVEIVIEIDGDDERLFVGAADGDGDGIDQRPVDQRAMVAAHRLENAGQGIGGAQRRNQRTIGNPDLMAGIDLGRDRDEWPVEILDVQAFEMFLHALGQPHAAEQAAAADGEVEETCDTAHRQRAREAFEFIEFAARDSSRRPARR